MVLMLRVSMVAGACALAAATAAHRPAFFNDAGNVAAAALGLILVGALAARRGGGGEMRVVSARRQAIASLIGGLAAWTAIFVVAVIAFDNRDALRHGALSAWSALAPGTAVSLDDDAVILSRERRGHFTADVEIYGQRLRMLVDTGSSDVALPYEAAQRLGFDVTTLVFDHPVMTANGQAMVAPLMLDAVSIGSIELRGVEASVAEPGRLGSPLLGMSFLGRLSEVALRGDKLFLSR